MPIVNGQYVYDTLPGLNDAGWQKQAFGYDGNRKDWSDSRTAAYNYLLKQQENAYNLELWNLTNQFNSPAAQMQRYQDAGLNPNLVYSQQNTTSPLSAAQNQAFRSQGTHAKKVQNDLATIGQIQGLVKSAAETYDYLTFGRPMNQAKLSGQLKQNEILASDLALKDEEVYRRQLENSWNQYLLTGEGGWQDSNGVYHSYSEGPHGTMYRYQSNTEYQNWQRVKYMVASLLPAQVDRLQALKKLDDFQYDLMQGKHGAVLDIDLGLGDTVNQWAKLIIFMSLFRM